MFSARIFLVEKNQQTDISNEARRLVSQLCTCELVENIIDATHVVILDESLSLSFKLMIAINRGNLKCIVNMRWLRDSATGQVWGTRQPIEIDLSLKTREKSVKKDYSSEAKRYVFKDLFEKENLKVLLETLLLSRPTYFLRDCVFFFFGQNLITSRKDQWKQVETLY
jgi:hypothetical protein